MKRQAIKKATLSAAFFCFGRSFSNYDSVFFLVLISQFIPCSSRLVKNGISLDSMSISDEYHC